MNKKRSNRDDGVSMCVRTRVGCVRLSVSGQVIICRRKKRRKLKAVTGRGKEKTKEVGVSGVKARRWVRLGSV